ncbi:hypothetical protein ACWGBV_34025 [Streptomyces sp. NPDC055051]
MKLAKGITWVNVNCVAAAGNGKLTLVIETVGEFDVTCTSNTPHLGVNQLDLSETRKGRFRIETTDHVQWIADIQVPD